MLNFKLVLPYDYKELLALMVCNIENRDCMLHSCDDCPGGNGVCEFLTSGFEEADDDEVVSFKQWIKNETFTNLATFQLPLNEYIDYLYSQLDHRSHYIILLPIIKSKIIMQMLFMFLFITSSRV